MAGTAQGNEGDARIISRRQQLVKAVISRRRSMPPVRHKSRQSQSQGATKASDGSCGLRIRRFLRPEKAQHEKMLTLAMRTGDRR